MTAASARTNRDAGAIDLVVVTKYASLTDVREVITSRRVLEVGENRVQDAEKKKLSLGALADMVRWRLIGHLQTNKARKAVSVFDAIDSVDSLKLASTLDAAMTGANHKLPVMIQVKLSERQTQFGVRPENLPELIGGVRRCSNLELQGLMGIAPDIEPVEAVTPSFRLLRSL